MFIPAWLLAIGLVAWFLSSSNSEGNTESGGVWAVIGGIFIVGMILMVLLVGGLFVWEGKQTARAAQEERVAVKHSQEVVATHNAKAQPRQWETLTRVDPATGKEVTFGAIVNSDNDLCTLALGTHVNGTLVADVECGDNKNGIRSVPQGLLEFKFDDRSTSENYPLTPLHGGFVWTVPTGAYYADSRAAYSRLVERLATAKVVAIQVKLVSGADYTKPLEGGEWVRFSLVGARAALEKAGLTALNGRATTPPLAKKVKVQSAAQETQDNQPYLVWWRLAGVYNWKTLHIQYTRLDCQNEVRWFVERGHEATCLPVGISPA